MEREEEREEEKNFLFKVEQNGKYNTSELTDSSQIFTECTTHSSQLLMQLTIHWSQLSRPTVDPHNCQPSLDSIDHTLQSKHQNKNIFSRLLKNRLYHQVGPTTKCFTYAYNCCELSSIVLYKYRCHAWVCCGGGGGGVYRLAGGCAWVRLVCSCVCCLS